MDTCNDEKCMDPCQHAVSGHHPRFAGGPKVARFELFTGISLFIVSVQFHQSCLHTYNMETVEGSDKR